MSVEEYLRLVESTADNVQRVGKAARTISRETKPVRKKAGKALKGMKSALEKANAMARKKNGDFKKGWNQSKLMSKAHKIRKGMR
tara:strand:- start:1515 stop:1769 length:255 start_codon:yes stop_codon:yes gene_type:complete